MKRIDSDLSSYSDKLWEKAYERGKKEALSVFEDIEHEIRKYLEDVCINENEAEGIMFCLDIIDNHMRGKADETDN